MFNLRACSLILPATALVLGGGAVAGPDASHSSRVGTAAAHASSPFLGVWELDLARMPDSYGPPPKRVTYRFMDVGNGLWRTEIVITGGDDSIRTATITYRRDGRAVTSEGNMGEGDSAALMSPAPNMLVLCIAAQKHLGSVRTYAISADGMEMTESAANVDDAGVPFVRNFHFKRIG